MESVLAPHVDEWGSHDIDYSRLTPQEQLYVDQVKEQYEEDTQERKSRSKERQEDQSEEGRGDGHG